jgi:hypothetical protein
VKAFAICAMSSAIAVLGIGIAYKGAAIVMGEGTVAFALSEEWLWQTGQSRMDVYTSVPTWMMASLTGLGQGLYIFTGGGAPGFARLLVEGGVLGAIALLFLHAAAFRCLMHLWQLMATRSIVPFLAGAYVSSVVTTINYVNSTDMWIWCFWGLPAIAWQAVARHRQATV